jgi:predicted nucleotidyltransferase
MPKRSSRSASSIYRDYEGIIRGLRQAAEGALARHPELERVILFGSMARGDYGLYSDADVILVLRSSDVTPFFNRIPSFLDDFLEAPVPVELFPYTQDELDYMHRTHNMFIRRALREGQVLAERTPATAAGDTTSRPPDDEADQ